MTAHAASDAPTPATAGRSPGAFGVRQAAFIGVGAMVGAGIFALLGAAGEVAGAAVWLSFLLAGGVAGLQGYSFAKFGARTRRPAGCSSTSSAGFGDGHVTGVLAWLILAANAIVTGDGGGVVRQLRQLGRSPTASEAWIKVFAVARRAGDDARSTSSARTAVARAQTVVVIVVIGILTVFAVATLANLDPTCSPSPGYPPFSDIVASVALTFFAFLGFGVVTFTAKDLADPARQLPRAMYLALGIATVDLRRRRARRVRHADRRRGDRVGRHRARRRRRAGARPGRLLDDDASPPCSPPPAPPTPACTRRPGCASRWRRSGSSRRCMGQRVGGRAPAWACWSPPRSPSSSPSGSTSPRSPRSAAPSPCSSSASCRSATSGSAAETGAKAWVLVLAVASTVVVLVSFVFTTLVYEPATAIALVVILALCVTIDALWKRARAASMVRLRRGEQ